jgi:hypothetical protein
VGEIRSEEGISGNWGQTNFFSKGNQMRIILKLDFNLVSGFPFGKSADGTNLCTKSMRKDGLPQRSSFRMVTHANYGPSPVYIHISKCIFFLSMIIQHALLSAKFSLSIIHTSYT